MLNAKLDAGEDDGEKKRMRDKVGGVGGEGWE